MNFISSFILPTRSGSATLGGDGSNRALGRGVKESNPVVWDLVLVSHEIEVDLVSSFELDGLACEHKVNSGRL
jgi:hypothetical protein